MRTILSGIAAAAVAACLIPGSLAAADFAWPVVRVIDGDTVAVDASADMPVEIAELRVRLRGVNTAETGHRAACEAERAAGEAAAAFTAEAVADASEILVRAPEWGAWGGRIVADLVLDGRSLAALLIAAGYDGDAWCAGAADVGAEVPTEASAPLCIERYPEAVKWVPPEVPRVDTDGDRVVLEVRERTVVNFAAFAGCFNRRYGTSLRPAWFLAADHDRSTALCGALGQDSPDSDCRNEFWMMDGLARVEPLPPMSREELQERVERNEAELQELLGPLLRKWEREEEERDRDRPRERERVDDELAI